MKQTVCRSVVLIGALILAAGCSGTTSSPEPTQAPAGDPILTFVGQVDNELALSMADLQGMDVVERTMPGPKGGEEETYTGVPLSALIARAQPADDATLTFTAVDAYSVDVPMSDAEACEDCIVAFHNDSLRLVMPDFGSSYWVKDLVSIEAK
jgi:DMSO/TMAO reductase YedYZ molybdopterin-dependent catalytic subunit